MTIFLCVVIAGLVLYSLFLNSGNQQPGIKKMEKEFKDIYSKLIDNQKKKEVADRLIHFHQKRVGAGADFNESFTRMMKEMKELIPEE